MTTDPFSPQRRIALLRISAISLLASGCSNLPPLFSKTATIPHGARSLKGEVRLGKQLLKQNSEIPEDTPLTTGPDSQAIFIRGSNAFLLRANSHLIFKRNQDGSTDATLEQGSLLSVFAPGRVTIRTPVAQIGIRGTGCYVEAYPEKSYICLCYGKGDIYSSLNGKLLMSIKTTHHDSPYNIYPDGELMAPMPFINHSDDELILLESLVGREPYFIKNDPQNSETEEEW